MVTEGYCFIALIPLFLGYLDAALRHHSSVACAAIMKNLKFLRQRYVLQFMPQIHDESMTQLSDIHDVLRLIDPASSVLP